jgi:hypothetical protein
MISLDMLRDVCAFLGFMIGSVARNTLANANAVRDAF